MIRLNNYKVLNNIFKVLSEITDNVKIELDTDGMRFSMLDKSHVCFISLEAEHHWFTEYKVTEATSLLLDTDEVKKILTRGKNGDELLIEYTPTNTTFTYINEELTRRFTTQQVDTEYETPVPPSIEYPVKIDLILNELLDTLADVKIYSDKCRLLTSKDKLTIEATDIMTGNYTGQINTVTNNDLHIQASYSLKYLEYLKSLTSINELITIEYGDDMPLTATIQDPEGLKIQYLLAPRIESDQ